MISSVDATGTPEEFGRLLTDISHRPDVAGVMVLACDANQFTPASIDPYLTACSIPLFGGVFPEILYDGRRYTQGTLVVGLHHAPHVIITPDLSGTEVNYDAVIDAQIDASTAGQTMFVWVDGLAANIHALVEALFHNFGLDVNYIGGGAGSMSFEQRPCLFTNQGLIADAAVMALLDVPGSIGVRHGWTSVQGPYRVTEAYGNVIKTLNWMPAFEIYRSVIAETSGLEISEANFFDIAKAFPFGIYRLGTEKIVRDPIQLGEDGALICVGDVPVDAHVDILTGTADSLVDSASAALDEARKGFAASPNQEPTTVLIDCISRTLFLQDEFQRELAVVHNVDAPLIGALTLGEIANSGKDYLEFYNKTAVVGMFAL